MKIKYIIIDGVYPVIVSPAHTHRDAARVDGGTVTSAGFFSLTYDDRANELKVRVFGESISLKLRPAADDERILERLFSEYT